MIAYPRRDGSIESERSNNAPDRERERIDWYSHGSDRGCARTNARTISESDHDAIVNERRAGAGPTRNGFRGVKEQVLDGNQLGDRGLRTKGIDNCGLIADRGPAELAIGKQMRRRRLERFVALTDHCASSAHVTLRAGGCV
jgi:hypothetical protein